MNYEIEYTRETLYYRYKKGVYVIYLIVALFVVAVISLLPVIKTQVSSQSRGIIRSIEENTPLITIVNGRIEQITIKNNTKTTKGDTIAVIDNQNIKSQKNFRQGVKQEHAEHLSDLRKLVRKELSVSSLQSSLYKAELRNYLTQKKILEKNVQHAQQFYNRYNQLHQEGVIATNEYEKHKNKLHIRN